MPNDMAPRPLRDQTAARIHPPSKTGRPILPATSFFGLDARQVFYAIMVAMPRDGAIIFSDLIGKLDMLRVTCASASATVATASPGSSISVAAMAR